MNKISDSNSSGLSLTYSNDRYHRPNILFNSNSIVTYSQYSMLQCVRRAACVFHLSQPSYYYYIISSRKRVFYMRLIWYCIVPIYVYTFCWLRAVTKATFGHLYKFRPHSVICRVKTISGLRPVRLARGIQPPAIATTPPLTNPRSVHTVQVISSQAINIVNIFHPPPLFWHQTRISHRV